MGSIRGKSMAVPNWWEKRFFCAHCLREHGKAIVRYQMGDLLYCIRGFHAALDAKLLITRRESVEGGDRT